MSKKKPAPTQNEFIKCADFDITVENSGASGLNVIVNVVDEDGERYFIKAKRPKVNAELIQKFLHTIADLWATTEFEFRANDLGEITEIRKSSNGD